MQLHVFLDAAVSIALDSCEAQTHRMRALDSLCVLHKGGGVVSLLVVSALRRGLLLFDLGLLHIRVALGQFRLVLPHQLACITQKANDPLQVLLKAFVLVLVQGCDLHAAEAKQRLDAAIDVTVLEADHSPQEILNFQRFEFRSGLLSF